ncbi:Set5-4 [Symbiodinium sp. CCMP2592]|nr:Set5-4 [Symbiodinium sp. CCMP2592]
MGSGAVLEVRGDLVVIQCRGEVLECSTEDIQVLSQKTISGILLTNAVTMESSDVARVFANFSRINHSCRPNARALQEESMRGVFTTVPVAEGEEICVSYFEEAGCLPAERLLLTAQLLDVGPATLHAAFVRQQLYSKWGFWCQCARCEPLADAADGALEQLS